MAAQSSAPPTSQGTCLRRRRENGRLVSSNVVPMKNDDDFAKPGSGQTEGGRLISQRKVVFFEFSLCLSRACLGKIMHFIYKWLKKCRFLACGVVYQVEQVSCLFENASSPFLSECFPYYVCPEQPVLIK